MDQSSVRLHVCARLSTVLTVVAITLTALSLSGCASHRKSVKALSREQMAGSIRTDSVTHLTLDTGSEITEIRTEPLKVPMSEVSLTIPTDSLHRLPNGAGYSKRSGRASVKVTRRSSTPTGPEYIYVYATCDSLQLLCEQYERTIKNMRRLYGAQSNGSEIRCFESSHEENEVSETPP